MLGWKDLPTCVLHNEPAGTMCNADDVNVVSCSSRDSLDAVVAALANSGGFNLAVLVSGAQEVHGCRV